MLRTTVILVVAGVVLLAVGMVSTVHAGPIPIDNITATGYSTYAEHIYAPINAVNGNGLSGEYPNEVHNSTPADNIWYAYLGGAVVDDYWFKVDLGASYFVETLRFWNCNYPGQANVGINQADIYYSNESSDPGAFPGAGWTLLGMAGEQTFDVGPAADNYGPPQEIPLQGVAARFVGLDINTDHGQYPDSTSIAEMQFVGELVPEPSTFALAALGLLSLGFVTWRRRKR